MDQTVTLTRRDDLANPAFWAALCPMGHLPSNSPPNVAMPNFDAGTVAPIRALLDREGYIGLQQFQDLANLKVLETCVRNVVAQGLPPVFAFLFDEAWSVYFRAHHAIAQLLDGDYLLLPDFWMWHVDPRKNESGWKPHRDKGVQSLFPTRRPKSLTMWVPVTEATPLNGCMYVVPAHLDPTYGTTKENDWKFEYSDIRALPCKPGDAFVWNQAVLHWGSRSSPMSSDPRISLAFEFQRKDVEPMNKPLLPPLVYLSFEQRLALISKQMLQYAHMYTFPSELTDFAKLWAVKTSLLSATP